MEAGGVLTTTPSGVFGEGAGLLVLSSCNSTGIGKHTFIAREPVRRRDKCLAIL